jgi:hypothetical protein
MRASTVMALALVTYVIHRWATNKTAVDARTVVEGIFAVVVIAVLDQGETEPIAKGFAWLFLVVALMNTLPTIATAASRPAGGTKVKIV